VASALAGALAVAAFGAVWLLGRSSADGRPTANGSPAAGTAPATAPVASPGVTRPADRPTSPAAVAGADSPTPATERWTTHAESGFSVPVPASWNRRAQGDNVFYEDPSTRMLLQVGTTPWTGDPESQAQTVSAAVARSFSGYREATVTPTTFLGQPAADLRFAYDRSTGTERVIDRFVRVNGTCFALYFRMPADQWASDSPRYLDRIFNGFQPS
jgi:eukaryotic-like serine/threonine-protein kinase